jgi:hypothetical protein
MIRIAITAAAFHAISATLPFGSRNCPRSSPACCAPEQPGLVLTEAEASRLSEPHSSRHVHVAEAASRLSATSMLLPRGWGHEKDWKFDPCVGGEDGSQIARLLIDSKRA